MSSEPKRLSVSITGMAYGGRGIGRVDGKVVFVPNTRPGDEAEVTIVSDSGKYMDADLVTLSRPATERITPQCPYFERCGGCQWQHSAYSEQLGWKRDSLASSLKRIGKIGADFPIGLVPAPDPFNYRSRATFRVRVEPGMESQIGYFAAASHEFVAIDACTIVDASLNAFIKNFSATRFGSLKLKARLEVLSALDGLLIFVHTDETWTKADVAEFGAVLPTIANVRAVEIHRGSGEIVFATWDKQFDLSFLSAPGQFQQANTSLNHSLRQYVRDVVNRVKPLRVLDLFCGGGNLSLGLPVRSVRGIEFNARAIDAANRSVVQNKLDPEAYEYFATDAEKHLWRVAKLGERFDFVIADPPREGMYKCVPPLLKLAPQWILYVSCNPTTLARDLGGICREYSIEEVQAYDFFPQTFHVESVVLLKRNSH